MIAEDAIVARRAIWSERWARPRHDLLFTSIGGRARATDPLDVLDPTLRRSVERALTQVAIVAPAEHQAPEDPDVAFWVTVCRKILQRGIRPPLSPRIDTILRERIGILDRLPAQVLAAAWQSSQPIELDASYQLHPQWEAPFRSEAQRVAPSAATWLIPQAPLETLVTNQIPDEIGRRWVDFLYSPPGQPALVLEIDGQGHERRLDIDAARDRLLADSGIRVLRASGPESIDPAGPLLRRLAQDEQTAAPLEARADLVFALHAPHVPARLALAVVEAVARGYLPRGGPWSLEVVDPFGVVDEVGGAALDPLRAVSELWGVGVVPASVELNGRTWQLSGGGAQQRPARRTAPTVRVRLEPETPFSARLDTGTDLPEIAVLRAGVPIDLGWLPGITVERRAMPPAPERDLHLHVLLADLFGHDAFRDGQLASLRQTLAGGDSVVLLPTGSGKSLIYQLAGLLMPGTTLVVDPLVSLIDDQERRLIRDGIDRVVAMHASRAGGTRTRDIALEQVASGDAHFIFLTPERFQNERFRDRLRASAREQLINLVVIDEAHTVSEWGHDFRTSYLRLARNVRRLCRDREDGWPPMLALTGTASPAVLRDVLRELEIDGEAQGVIQRPRTHDRPNLTYRKISGPDADWLTLVIDALTDTVPRNLGVEVSALADLVGLETLSGIVFCPWAKGEHGVDRVREALQTATRALGCDMTAEVYSGGSPFGEGSEGGWAAQRARSAQRFKDNEIALLVATKAFGMGIDKPNIRYTIHAGFPSSIEAFAQEAGRAGRNGEPAVCVLTTALPEPEVVKHLLDRTLSAETRRARGKGVRSAEGGDLTRQLFFYGNSFPGATEEADLALKLFTWMRQRGAGPGARALVPVKPKRGEEKRDHEQRKARVDRALYRLAAIGVVEDLTVNGQEITAYLARYDARTIDGAFLAYATRVEPGNEAAHRQTVGGAPGELDGRVAHHLRALTQVVYRIVAAARLTALDNMHQLARGSDDPQYLRARINAYLGEGPAAAILAEAVAITPIDVPRFVAALETLPVEDVDQLAGASARQREAYPDHPLLWFSTALSTAREPDGAEDRFRDALTRSLAQFGEYGIAETQAAAAVSWLIRRLRNENAGRRWNWTVVAMEAWETTKFSDALLEDVEVEALVQARRGRFQEQELEAIARRRLHRHAVASVALAERHTIPVAHPEPEE